MNFWGILSLIFLFFSSGSFASQDAPKVIWDPKFESIKISQRVGNSIRDAISFDFKEYWPSYPFTIKIADGPIVIFPKIGPPPVIEKDSEIDWDKQWEGELHLRNRDESEEFELISLFNASTQNLGIVLPSDKIGNNNQIAIYIYSLRNDQRVIYDRFVFSLSGATLIDTNIPDSSGGGEGGPVVIQIPCYISGVSSPSSFFSDLANSSSFSVSTSRVDCEWEITKSVTWITVQEPLVRTGNSVVSFSVAENTTNEVRVGQIVVNGVSHTVIQRGKPVAPPVVEIPCTSSLSESVSLFPISGGNGSYQLTASSGTCEWRIEKEASATWVTVSGSNDRTGNSLISYTVSPNTTTQVRTARIRTLNATYVIVQEAVPTIETIIETPCYATEIDRGGNLFDFSTGSGSFNVVSSKTTCSWNITKDSPWITISGATTRTGNSTVNYTVAANNTDSTRVGNIIAFNQKHTIVQLPKEKEEVLTPEITSLLLNVSMGTRIYNSSNILLVSENSIDPFVDSVNIPGNTGMAGYGYVQAWGRNNTNQYGNNDRASSFSPVIALPENIWSVISAGVGYAAGIDLEGNLYTWGINTFGQLAHGDTRVRTIPTLVDSNLKWRSVSVGRGHLIAIDSNGEIWTAGRNVYGQLGNNSIRNSTTLVKAETSKTDWVYVFASADSSYAIDESGNLFAWGYNNQGQLGNGNRLNSRIPIPVAEDLKWNKVVSGESHVIGITNDGKLYGWGRNNRGQLGTGSISFVAIPDPVLIDDKNTWIDVAAGFEYSMALTEEGSVFSSGLNNFGQLGIGNAVNTFSFSKVSLENVEKIFAGYYHSFAILASKEVFTWGRNEEGQLGLGFNNPRRIELPTRNPLLASDTLYIACGDFYTLSLNGVEIIIEEEDDSVPVVQEFQTLAFVPVGNTISVSWKGTSLLGKNVRISLQEGNNLVFDNVYSSGEKQTESFLVSENKIYRFEVRVWLLGENQTILQTMITRFLVMGT